MRLTQTFAGVESTIAARSWLIRRGGRPDRWKWLLKSFASSGGGGGRSSSRSTKSSRTGSAFGGDVLREHVASISRLNMIRKISVQPKNA